MERVKERLRVARQALATLQELATKSSLSTVERDAMIQRFEYTFETVWKSAQTYLRVVEGITANSPKSAVRFSWQTGLLDEKTTSIALQMCEDRNMTVYTYNEKIASSLAFQIREYSRVLQMWLTAMENRISETNI